MMSFTICQLHAHPARHICHNPGALVFCCCCRCWKFFFSSSILYCHDAREDGKLIFARCNTKRHCAQMKTVEIGECSGLVARSTSVLVAQCVDVTIHFGFGADASAPFAIDNDDVDDDDDVIKCLHQTPQLCYETVSYFYCVSNAICMTS